VAGALAGLLFKRRAICYPSMENWTVSAMDIRSTIFTVCQTVAEEQQKTLAPLTDDLPLLESGLDSLCVAVIVARLEDRLGFDPFSSDEDFEFPVTIGDFVRLYEGAAASA
jgi:acyl carrier protein